jgi:16S rRNA (guanine527-N7)-methyltransferase
MSNLEKLLTEGLAELGLAHAGLLEPLTAYARLLRKWNRVYNLTALNSDEEVARLYLLDSLTALPFLQGPNVLDVGTGGGTPGIPLALARPDLQFVLLDSSAKKTRFVRQAVIELELSNVQVETGRVERFSFPQGFATIVSRAFSSLEDFVALTRHLLREDGVWLAMKGQVSLVEQEGIRGLKIETVPVKTPGVDGARHIVILRDG